MRTTIELDDTCRGRLLALAAKRGKKGFSDLVNEAVLTYLDAHDAQTEKQQAAARLLGFLTNDEADSLAEGAATARASWRAGDNAGR